MVRLFAGKKLFLKTSFFVDLNKRGAQPLPGCRAHSSFTEPLEMSRALLSEAFQHVKNTCSGFVTRPLRSRFVQELKWLSLLN